MNLQHLKTEIVSKIPIKGRCLLACGVIGPKRYCSSSKSQLSTGLSINQEFLAAWHLTCLRSCPNSLDEQKSSQTLLFMTEVMQG